VKVALGADHAGFAAKEELKTVLKALGHEVLDVGTTDGSACDYPDIAAEVSRRVVGGECERGVLVCGTGIGMSISANKIPGIRAALICDEKAAALSRQHNDANVFCAGARTQPVARIAEHLKLWMESAFEGGRHERRVDKIRGLEQS
jgi:RpiB/LacA/LacB family sugar-phosphate isomerase